MYRQTIGYSGYESKTETFTYKQTLGSIGCSICESNTETFTSWQTLGFSGCSDCESNTETFTNWQTLGCSGCGSNTDIYELTYSWLQQLQETYTYRENKGGEIRTPAMFRTQISHVPRLQSRKNCFKVGFSVADFRVTEVLQGKLLRFSGFLSSIPYEQCVSSSNNNLLTCRETRASIRNCVI